MSILKIEPFYRPYIGMNVILINLTSQRAFTMYLLNDPAGQGRCIINLFD